MGGEREIKHIQQYQVEYNIWNKITIYNWYSYEIIMDNPRYESDRRYFYWIYETK